MQKKLVSLGLFVLLAFMSTDLLAKAFKANVYECEGDELSITYSEATWNGVPIFVIHDKGSVTNKIEHRGNAVTKDEDDEGLIISVPDNSTDNQETTLGLYVPKVMLEPFDQIVEVQGVLLRPEQSTFQDDKNDSYAYYTLIPLKCRASHHVE